MAKITTELSLAPVMPRLRHHAERVLMLVTSDLQRDQIAEQTGAAPKRDYLDLARRLDADIFDNGAVRRGRIGRLLSKLIGRGPAHALLALPRAGRYDVVFSDSEHVGLFLGIFLRLRPNRPRHVVLAHHLTPSKKHAFVKLGRGGIDAFILHSEAQRQFATSQLGLPPAMLRVLPYQVDRDFWQPQHVAVEDMVATAGLECRDYETLLDAVKDLPLEVRIGAASNWSRKKNSLSDRPPTDQVTVTSYSYAELRDVYAHSRFVVVPLLDVDFQAGITTILEAMAMAKAVVTTRTKGHCGAVLGPLWLAGMTEWPPEADMETATGIYVLPGDTAGLKAVMSYLRENPAIACRLGENGRLRVSRDFTLEQFSQRFTEAILGPDSEP